MQRRAALVVPMVYVGLAVRQKYAANALAVVPRRYRQWSVAHVDDVRIGLGLHELLHALGPIVYDRFVYGCHRASIEMVHIRVVFNQHANDVRSISLLFSLDCSQLFREHGNQKSKFVLLFKNDFISE